MLPNFRDWGLYHFSGEPAVTWLDFAQEIFRQADAAVRLDPVSSVVHGARAARPSNSELDCRKISRVFGLNQPDWRPAIADLIIDP